MQKAAVGSCMAKFSELVAPKLPVGTSPNDGTTTAAFEIQTQNVLPATAQHGGQVPPVAVASSARRIVVGSTVILEARKEPNATNFNGQEGQVTEILAKHFKINIKTGPKAKTDVKYPKDQRATKTVDSTKRTLEVLAAPSAKKAAVETAGSTAAQAKNLSGNLAEMD